MTHAYFPNAGVVVRVTRFLHVNAQGARGRGARRTPLADGAGAEGYVVSMSERRRSGGFGRPGNVGRPRSGFGKAGFEISKSDIEEVETVEKEVGK
jgi:hypothetical protein